MTLEKLFQFSNTRIQRVSTKFLRYLYHQINWSNRLIAITGARGVGKTTLLLQYIKLNLKEFKQEVIFVNLDDLYFAKNTLINFVEDFVKRGGKYLFLDEVHKYQQWSQEIKNIYDYFPELKIVITGSSNLNIFKGQADLSRRAIHYHLQGLSLREYLALGYDIHFPAYPLSQLLQDPGIIAEQIISQVKPIKVFESYLKHGYYPFFIEGLPEYTIRIRQIVNHLLEVDLPSIQPVEMMAVNKMKKLLAILAEVVPYKPNVSKLSEQIEVSRETLIKYMYLLAKADLLLLLHSDTKGTSSLNKPEKVYLENGNLFYALTANVNTGALRETFFYNQFKQAHNVFYSKKGDFVVDDIYTFEIGGKGKSSKQIASIEQAFIAADNIEYPYHNKIPLWLFGFLY